MRFPDSVGYVFAQDGTIISIARPSAPNVVPMTMAFDIDVPAASYTGTIAIYVEFSLTNRLLVANVLGASFTDPGATHATDRINSGLSGFLSQPNTDVGNQTLTAALNAYLAAVIAATVGSTQLSHVYALPGIGRTSGSDGDNASVNASLGLVPYVAPTATAARPHA
jgi:hypothetical protein